MKTSWFRYLTIVLLCLPVLVPIGVVLFSLTTGESESWSHLRDNLLIEYIANTFSLAILVGSQTLIIGVGCAWLTTAFSFPGMRFFSWALVLPLAVPAYIAGYVYAELFEYAGPLQTLVRQVLFEGSSQINLINIRSIWGASFVISMVLFPYVYLLTRISFQKQSSVLRSAASSLGEGTTGSFFKLILPLSRPAIAGGTALVLMETMADYGVVEHFGVPTFTTGIFRTWYGMGDQNAALQLSACLFLLVAILITAEQFFVRGSTFNPTSDFKQSKPTQISGFSSWMATLACTLPLLFGFIVPLSYLMNHALQENLADIQNVLSQYMINSIQVASIGAAACVGASLWLAYTNRAQKRLLIRSGIKLSTLGYALPGVILAIGLLVPLTSVDHLLAEPISNILDTNPKLWLTGSILALVAVYFARFLTVSYNSIQGGMAQLDTKFDLAASTLGATTAKTLSKIHFPLLSGSLMTGFLLVFIDITKELPATLILRPFNFETLSTRIYRFASDERLSEASVECLILIALGLVLTSLLISSTKNK